MIDLPTLQRMFTGIVSPEDIETVYQEMQNGAHAHTKYDKNLFQIIMDDGTHATISMKLDEGIESFRCSCGHKGPTFCKHFIYLMSAASNIVDDLDNPDGLDGKVPRSNTISTLEYKVSRSKSIPPELKSSFKTFKKAYPKLWQQYQSSSTKRELNQNHSKLFSARNDLMDECFDAAYDIRQSGNIIGSFETLLYSLFAFCKIIGGDNHEMLEAIECHFCSQLRVIYRKSKAPEKQQMWTLIAKSFQVTNTNKLPVDPALRVLTDFIIDNYTTNKYYNQNLDLFDTLIDHALSDGNDYIAERWALEYLYLLEKSDITEDDLYNAYHEWWKVPAIRLNYLEHCMSVHNYFSAYTLATDCLNEKYLFDEDEIIRLHEILLGSSYKLDKFGKSLEEAAYLAQNSPDSLMYELRFYIEHDKKRWPKIKTKMAPIFSQAEKNLVKQL